MAMQSTGRMGLVIGGLALAALAASSAAAGAQTIVDKWASVKIPPAPELKHVKADPKTMAFLVLDMVSRICKVPACLDTVPGIAKFLGAARAHKMPVVYSSVNGQTAKNILEQVAPKGDEPLVVAHADKFIDTDLDKVLKGLGVKTVIVVGTAAQGAVLYTASHAAFLGYKVVVPVEGMSSPDAFGVLASAWMLTHAPSVGAATTLTRFDMIDW